MRESQKLDEGNADDEERSCHCCERQIHSPEQVSGGWVPVLAPAGVKLSAGKYSVDTGNQADHRDHAEQSTDEDAQRFFNHLNAFGCGHGFITVEGGWFVSVTEFVARTEAVGERSVFQ